MKNSKPKKLPKTNVKRMLASHKKIIVEAIRDNYLAFETACIMYGFSSEELNNMILKHGMYGESGLMIKSINRIRTIEKTLSKEFA